jgi:aspartyl-tRNA synthetase
MIRTVKIKNLSKHIGEVIAIKGWVSIIRDQKKRQFLVIRDITGSVQVVNEKEGHESLSRDISNLTIESTIKVIGKIIENENVKLGGIELILDSIEVYSVAEIPLPVDSNSSQEKRLDWRFIDLRNSEKRLIFRLQTLAENSMREFWRKNNFIEIHSPKFMGTASESGAELFKVQYFDKIAYLAQSPQFYKQMAMASGFDRIFEIGPVFRANPSFTSRHDTEFTSVDVEVSWIDSHEEIMKLEEEWLQFVVSAIKHELGDEIKEVYGVDVNVPEIPFPRVTMEEAYEILSNEGYQVARENKGDLDPEGERILARYIKKFFGHEFVFVTDYPIEVRPFYHMRHENRPELTKSYDLLWNGLEVTTGAQREHRQDVLIKQIKEKGLETGPLQSYLNFFKYGCPPHGGYGFGLSRMLMIILGLKNVREVTYLYRGPNRLLP